MKKSTDKKIGVSVIIPVYNSADWIGTTLDKLFLALEKSAFDAEVIVVNDGSTDDSVKTIQEVRVPKGIHLKLINKENQGRYLARKTGVDASSKETVLFLDSRVYVTPNSLRFLSDQLRRNIDQIWNGHVHVVKDGNPFARFWDAIACIGWRRYFRNPKTTQYGVEDFDYYPKGTGFFFVPRKILDQAMAWFEKNTNDIEHSSDDTLLIRRMNESHDIHISPNFSCLYHGRSTLGGFLKHAYHRGEFFVDGFLRPGTRFYYPLLTVLTLSVVAVCGLLLAPVYTAGAIILGCLLLSIALFFGARILGIVWKDALSLGALGVPFAFVYLAGIWTGVWHRIRGNNA